MPRSEGVAFDDIVGTYPYSGDHQAWTYYTTMAQVNTMTNALGQSCDPAVYGIDARLSIMTAVALGLPGAQGAYDLPDEPVRGRPTSRMGSRFAATAFHDDEPSAGRHRVRAGDAGPGDGGAIGDLHRRRQRCGWRCPGLRMEFRRFRERQRRVRDPRLRGGRKPTPPWRPSRMAVAGA